MTRLFNEPSQFADELVKGFVAANSQWVRPVAGGVVRRAPTVEGQTAVVVGGGSGHYPAFGGIVGPGLAHGAAMGNLFASPSAQQVHSVAVAAENRGGVLLTFGNYAGDVLNFATAEARLNSEGIVTRTVVVTDDISSAPVGQEHKRRGIAGDLTVFKAAAAAAEAGYSLDEVVRVATEANDRTRSIGVAFSGCTLPGQTEPLFTVPAGRMAVGMGIHGEPGIAETDVPTANELAELLVSSLLAELPPSIATAQDARAAVILNGLGSVKYEELFVVYGRVAELLEAAGITVVEPEVGELVTSFDMAGVSLTLFWLNDELEGFWRAGADTPAYKKGRVGSPSSASTAASTADTQSFAEADRLTLAAETAASLPTELPDSSDASRDAALAIADAIEAIAEVIDEHADELGRIDAVAGDGDHGIGMQRGSRAAATAARSAALNGAGALSALSLAGDAWADRAGGTSGALWGLALQSVGAALGNTTEVTGSAVATGVSDAVSGIQSFGKAVVGDKTMVDAMVPFTERLSREVNAGGDLVTSWRAAAEVATAAAAGTADLLPRMGRARPHAEKSLGTPDAGAHSFALIVVRVGEVLASRHSEFA
ncbi:MULTISPECIES: dihydroxyacetone kinase family protein [Subtercola]|uniref:Dihydroxyacetone kinase family protein n=1 Tax=Subtercola vilae TaxID=2056433 RepID=A0A4T2C3I1_9MICO|nr:MULTISPECIES: dihydroxyacetone kinase family protein [Subtercola]MEA9984159.1 dihydroxyacetone kinase family protein [Subtercola sp. RTI3]TIH38627.1 dihydroxyacetone kinase family protein [Subtercola vilae]